MAVTGARAASVALVVAWTVAIGPSIGTQAASTGQASRPQGVAAPAAAAEAATSEAVLQRYCLTCHNARLKERGVVPVAFEALNPTRVDTDAAMWEGIVRRVRTGMMPPAAAPRPDVATHDKFVQAIEAQLDRSAVTHPNPGRTEPLHRLNRTEYHNAIRDLLDVDLNVTALLPADSMSAGFDNIAGVLKMSPTLIERYLDAAQKISRMAIGTPAPSPTVDYFRLSDDLPQDLHLEGMPLGTRGGTKISYTFPMDGEYVIRPRLSRDQNFSIPAYPEPQSLEVSIDGARVHVFTVPGVVGARGGRGALEPDPNDDDVPPPTDPNTGSGAGNAGTRGAGPGRRTGAGQAGVAPAAASDREARNRIDENWEVRVRVPAGRHEVTLAFLKKTSAIDETVRMPFMRPYAAAVNTPETRMTLHLRSVEIAGPYSPTGPGASRSRQRIMTCTPVARSEEATCAKSILSAVARRAFRRPVTDADLEPAMTMYREGRRDGNFDLGIERGLKRVLVSPEFLYRVERDPANIAPNTPYQITELELASRLSFFLWSSIPDDELLTLATKKRLRQPGVLQGQVRRMLADWRSDAFVDNFAGQWLYLRNLAAVGPVATIFPDFDESLRQAMQRETELFVRAMFREDRPAVELLSADFTFVNERLARHYGIPGVKGSHFRRIAVDREGPRSGLLGQASILTVTSQPDRTSPVVRGKWVLENFLGTVPPPPPTNLLIPELKSSLEPGAVLSMRDRMVAHRSNSVCAGCHAMMDPIGLSLENFDGIGQLRMLGESSTPIDASGGLPDGSKFVGVTGLRRALMAKPDQFVTTLTEKLMTYALGRGLEYYDQPAVRTIVRAAARDDYRLSSDVIAGVVQSMPFQMRRSRP